MERERKRTGGEKGNGRTFLNFFSHPHFGFSMKQCRSNITSVRPTQAPHG